MTLKILLLQELLPAEVVPFSISIEAVREFKITTNQYDVTLGRSGGGTVSAVTKSGTNKFSGSAWEYLRTNWLSSPYDIRGNKRRTISLLLSLDSLWEDRSLRINSFLRCMGSSVGFKTIALLLISNLMKMN
jgi:hypothetical protein